MERLTYRGKENKAYCDYETRDIINKFMAAYFTYKDNDEKGWKITRNVIFYRLDSFNDRIGDILNVARSYNEFLKMSTNPVGVIAPILRPFVPDVVVGITHVNTNTTSNAIPNVLSKFLFFISFSFIYFSCEEIKLPLLYFQIL